jgi:uncharacterized phage-associated protein
MKLLDKFFTPNQPIIPATPTIEEIKLPKDPSYVFINSTNRPTLESVATYFIHYEKLFYSEPISEVKLQNLLFLANGYYLVLHGISLFENVMKAESYGVSIRNIDSILNSIRKIHSQEIPDPGESLPAVIMDIHFFFQEMRSTRLQEVIFQNSCWLKHYLSSETLIDSYTLYNTFKNDLEYHTTVDVFLEEWKQFIQKNDYGEAEDFMQPYKWNYFEAYFNNKYASIKAPDFRFERKSRRSSNLV